MTVQHVRDTKPKYCSTFLFKPGYRHISSVVVLSLYLLMLFVSQTQGGSWFFPNRKCECPMNVSSTMGEEDQLDGLFRGLFNNESDLESVLEAGYEVENWSRIAPLDIPGKCEGSGCDVRSLREVDVVEMNLSDCCCESKQFIIQPLTVQKNNKLYDVVHLPDAPQLLTTSTCSEINKSCGSGGTCMEMQGYNWILIYDVALKYYPPVKFVPIKFPTGCACVF